MEWLKSKTTLVAGGCLALIGLQGYGMMSMRSTMEERVSSVERELQTMHNEDSARVAQLTSDLDTVTKRMGITAQELEDSHAIAEQLKKDNASTAQRLRRELASKADSKAINQFREEAVTKLNAVQQDTSNKIQGVSGEVQVVRTDLDTTRSDLAKSRSELGTLIAHNSTELAELRRRGERNYVEFDISRAKNTQRVGDVLVQLKKTDVKKQKYDVVINADDLSILKKDRTANEPVTFMVGSDRVRYEFVVNSVDKDRIRGYLSTPKDKVLAAETPASAQRLQ
jgi:Skp family chaperone for outer membrane proteins